MKTKTERNNAIVVKILNGMPIKKVAEEYGISSEATRIILHRSCKRANPELYAAGIWVGVTNKYHTPKLRYLVEHKRHFLKEIII